MKFKRRVRQWEARHWRFSCTIMRRAFEAGIRFRIRYGSHPYWMSKDRSSNDWNGSAPYSKYMSVPSRLGMIEPWWARNQDWRIAWEQGWSFEERLRAARH